MTPLNHFDRSKPFYPLVMNYLVLLQGMKEISARGLAKILSDKLKVEDNLSEEEIKKIVSDIIAKEHSKTKELFEKIIKHPPLDYLPDLNLTVRTKKSHIKVPTQVLERELIENQSYLLRFTLRAAGSLLILAYETTKQWHDNSELWEFLRHCRNAAAHNGKFTIWKIPYPAKWRNIEIIQSMHGKPLFYGPHEPDGVLGPGDPVELLWEIEQKFSQMQV